MPRIPSRVTTKNRTTPEAKRRAASGKTLSKNTGESRQVGVDAIATRIRSARRRSQISLETLSTRVGLDKGYLSRIERGQKAPSAATLLNLAAALDIHVAHLFGDTTPREAITVMRRDEHTRVPSDSDGPGYETILGANADRRMSVFLTRPLEEAPVERVGHSGDELIYVISGSVEVLFVDRVVALQAGDVVHFGGDLKHQIRKVGAAAALALIVVANDLSAARKTGK